jgi:aminoglycoside phosphotransferase family enzyme/predicted kinase
VEAVELIETHISWVLLAGDLAYKIKKPVNPGFLDFTTLEKRKYFCDEELRVNKRLAPEIYIDVVAIGERDGRPVIGACGEALEYAVRMNRFDQDGQLDRQLEAGRLTSGDIDELASYTARFHESADVAGKETEWGSPDVIRDTVMGNFAHLDAESSGADLGKSIRSLRRWTETNLAELETVFLNRKADGFVRECHGDLHLRNIARVGDRIIAFDGIEFSPSLRWIDIVSDAAFLMMDLASRGRPDLGWRYLNGWLAVTGDYGGLPLLRWYLVYRHLVRAKVDTIRLTQTNVDKTEREHLSARLSNHVTLAAELMQVAQPAIIIVSGLSGSGKSWLAKRLATCLPAIWIRSDVERKRICTMLGNERENDTVGGGIYAADATQRTYDRLMALTAGIVESRYNALVDATFLDVGQRRRFRELAQELNVPFRILSCEADESVLRKRVSERRSVGTDPSDAGLKILQAQLKSDHRLTEAERSLAISVRTDRNPVPADIANTLRQDFDQVPG